MDTNDSGTFVLLSNSGMIADYKEETSNGNRESLLKECTTQYGSEPARKNLRCPECLRFTTHDQDKMTRHIRRVHQGVNPYQCDICEYSTYNSCVYNEHVNIHKGIKPFQCSYCPHRSVSKKNLKRHEYIHRPDNPLKCLQCDFIARNQKSFICHVKTKHTDTKVKGLVCSYCNKKFTAENMLVHSARVKTCSVILNRKRCTFTTCSFQRMSSHKQNEHAQKKRLTKPNNKKQKVKVFNCRLCEWSSNKKPRILLHLIHHPNQVVDKGVVDLSILIKHNIMV
ncbi:zinc finger protein 225 [Bicyclus anynana]|uniref:Zinc finger protein 225 n=1 Tax=Bicyclus anynana TaxID=110368 RepID=A0A6J1NI29_BICAN|nr:zinc finger protein 225 [Bicyclus anynana]